MWKVMLGVMLLSGCAVHRYNNCTVNNLHDPRGAVRIEQREIGQASEGTSQEKRLRDVGSPTLPLR